LIADLKGQKIMQVSVFIHFIFNLSEKMAFFRVLQEPQMANFTQDLNGKLYSRIL
jgi:hypothetical protein